LSETEEERDTRRLVEFIRSRGGKVTARTLQRSNSRKYPAVEPAEAALEALVQADLGTWTDPITGPKGGHPTRWFILRPTHDTTDTTPDDGAGDHDDPPQGPHDTTPDATPRTPNNPSVLEGSVGSVMRRTEVTEAANTGEIGEGSFGSNGVVSGGSVMRVQSGPGYLLVQDRAGLEAMTAALEETKLVAIDTETTGLDPGADRVRLLTLNLDTTDDGRFSYIVDAFRVDLSPLWELLAAKELVLHNAAFDLAFLARLGFIPMGKVYDTMLLAQLLTAGTADRNTLVACCERHLGRALDKAEQRGDWSGKLTAAQLAYAAADVEVLPPLLEALVAKIKEAGLVEVARIEQRCLPAIVWLASRGVALDVDTWQGMDVIARDEALRLRQELDQDAPARPGNALFVEPWNWDSTQQAQQALALAGVEVADTADETLAAVEHPLAELLRRYRHARKRSSTYGTDWLKHVAEDNRVYASWRQIGAASGRMSCSDPNMQNLPRGDYRRCIVAPPGRVLVKADYSQIELRIAAKVSGDKALLAAYQRGDDLHTMTARNVLGIADVTKEHRQLAKALNFGLLYGMGARGFRQYAKGQYGLDLSEADAHRYRTAFFKSYPGLAQWHRRVRSQRVTETRTLAGRRRLLDAKTPDTQRLNTPVQGTGADGLKLALALLWERRTQAPGAFPVLAVHDEVVVEADAGQADAVAVWLKAAMVDAITPLVAPVPVEVEVKTARTWGGK
jgi:DNA polymerase I-like protein with 3'-5' exonuclease and polymerase domains